MSNDNIDKEYEPANKDLIKRCLSIISSTEPLTHNSANNNARAAAYKNNRERADELALRSLVNQTDESEMLAELELLENDAMND